MIFKMLPAVEGEPQIYARIDDDGLCRLTCTAEYPEFVAWVEEGMRVVIVRKDIRPLDKRNKKREAIVTKIDGDYIYVKGINNIYKTFLIIWKKLLLYLMNMLFYYYFLLLVYMV